MSVKLNHYWSIIPELNEEYEKFILKKFIPGVNSLGLHTVAVWSVLIGAYSEIMFENAASNLGMIETALKDNKFISLKKELFHFIKNYKTKILSNTGKLDNYSKDVRDDTIKFNQTWDVLSHKSLEYDDFFLNEYIPVLEKLGISVAGEWEILIGEGPVIICEGRVSDSNNLIANLQGKEFQNAKRKLKSYIENYNSRILTFHIKKKKGYKSESYHLVNSGVY
jgi:hypothetical protein